MGNSNSNMDPEIHLNPQSITAAIATLKSSLIDLNLSQPPQNLYTALKTINAEFLKNNIYEVRENNQTYINPLFLTLWFDPNFSTLSEGWFNQWKSILAEVAKSSAVLIKLKSWKFLNEFTKFIACLSSDRIFYILNNIAVLALHQQSKSIVKQNTASTFDDEPKINFIDALSRNQAQSLYKTILIVLSNFLSLKNSALSRSQSTLDEVSKLLQTCFVMFCRLYFNQKHHNQLRKRAIKVNNQTNLQQSAYFLGISFQYKNSSLFDICVVFIISLVHGNKINPKITNLPSYLFPSLPTSLTSNLYVFILQTLLFTLTQRKNQNNHIQKISCNRINALRLAYYLIKYQLATLNSTSIDYLVNICVYSKIDNVERVFVVFLIQQALKICETQILKKYMNFLSKPFEVSLANAHLKYETDQLVNYMTSSEQYLGEEMQTYYYDYLLENILLRKRGANYQDKTFWKRMINSKRQNKVTC